MDTCYEPEDFEPLQEGKTALDDGEAWVRFVDLIYGRLDGVEALVAEHQHLVLDQVDRTIY